VWLFVDWNIFLRFPNIEDLIFQTISACGQYQYQKKLYIAFNEVTYSKYKYQLWGKKSTVTKVINSVCRNVTWTLGCAVNCLATVDVTDTSGQWSERRRVVLIAMTVRRRTHDKHVTVPDAVELVSVLILQQSE